jgi:hypothetical protein
MPFTSNGLPIGIFSIATSRRFLSSLPDSRCFGRDLNSASWKADAYWCLPRKMVLQRTIRRSRVVLFAVAGQSFSSGVGRFRTVPLENLERFERTGIILRCEFSPAMATSLFVLFVTPSASRARDGIEKSRKCDRS